MGHNQSMLLGCSHVVLASDDVKRMTKFFSAAFAIAPAFANDMFSEFVLPSKFRVAFFKPVGASAKRFDAGAERTASALGITVADVDAAFRTITVLTEFPIQVSGPPKEHPWGEKSFLLTDPDGNRWEIAQSPSPDGMLRDR